MAIIVNSRFRPFSMDEMLKVVMPAAQMQKETEDALGEIDMMSSVWEKLKKSEIDKDVYSQYQNFQGNLQRAIYDLYKNGVNVNSRRTLGQMKARYAKEIAPIEEAYNRRNTLAEEQRQAMLKDDSILWQNRASNISLRDIMNNPSMDYGRAVSGDKLTARVAQSASALAKELSNNPQKLNELLGGDYFEYVKDRGYSSESILAAINELRKARNNNKDYNSKVETILQDLVREEIFSAGIDNTWSDEAWERAFDYASKGLWQAIGQDEAQIVQNWRKQQDNQHAFQASENEKNRQFQREQTVPRQMLDDNGNPTNHYYDPKLGVIVDDEGRVVPNKNGGVKLPGGGSGSGRTTLTPEEKAENNLAQKEYEKLANVSSYDSMIKTGYTPIFITANHKGTWESLNEGEDLHSATGSWTVNSSLITKGSLLGNAWHGNATFKPRTGTKGEKEGGVRHVAMDSKAQLSGDMSLIEVMNTLYPSIPKEAMSSMLDKMLEQGIVNNNGEVTKSFEIFKVRAERGNGNSGEDWDYMVNVKD